MPVMRTANIAIRGLIASLLVLCCSSVGAQPFAYAVNSDAEVDADHLYRINLSSGVGQVLGDTTFKDIEGLSFNEDGDLIGADDESDSLLKIDLATGFAQPLGSGRGNLGFSGLQDYGLSFACDSYAYIASDSASELYRVDPQTLEVTSIGSTGVSLSGLAAKQTKLYGIGTSGAEGIYEVDMETGATELIVSLGQFQFDDAGLSFDEDGNLWAILDKSLIPFVDEPSIILRIDLAKESAWQVATTEEGFESLAIQNGLDCSDGTSPTPPPEAIPVDHPWALLLLMLGVVLVSARELRG